MHIFALRFGTCFQFLERKIFYFRHALLVLSDYLAPKFLVISDAIGKGNKEFLAIHLSAF